MFSTQKHRQRLERARRIPDTGQDFLMRQIVDDLMERLSMVERSFDDAVALFGRTSYLAESLETSSKVKRVVRQEETTGPDHIGLPANSGDLVIAPLTLHWANDLPGALLQIAHILRPDGLLLAALPGPDTLHELRDCLLTAESEIGGGAASRIDLFTDIRDAGSLLQRAGLALPVVDQTIQIVRYDTMFNLIADLRAFGATAQREDQTFLNRETIFRAADLYQEKYADTDGRIRASFSFVFMSGWSPHKSQQKPLKPGSAEVQLAKALKT